MNKKKLLNAVIVGLIKTRIVTSAIEISISCVHTYLFTILKQGLPSRCVVLY
jgi:hypothetical protein